LLTNLQNHGSGVALVGNSPTTFKEIVEGALILRKTHSHYEGAAVGIRYTNLKDFIVALCAFDTFCASLYLLPENGLLPEHAFNASSITLWPDDIHVDVFNQGRDSSNANTYWFIATSGTTSTPKWIEHSFEKLIGNVKISESMSSLCWGLLYQPFRFAGLQVLLQSLISGASLLDASVGNVNDKVMLLNLHQASAVSATPGLWRQMMMSHDFKKLRLSHVTLGGEVVDQALLNALSVVFPNAKIRHIYASTEAGVGFVVSDKKAGFPAEWLNNDTLSATMFIDEQQHLWIKSPFASQAMCDESDFPEYIDTQDVVEVVSDRVFFLGRANGTINVGGNKVHPERVEQIILSVHGVQSARVYGRRNGVLGQLVHADVILNQPDTSLQLKKEIIENCKLKLERYEVPVTIKFVDSLEVTSAGKVKRETDYG
jgi:acyl-CoA synthetase (AMP-forming)/AMP-acid ligase II